MSQTDIHVKKRNGNLELLDLDKIHKVLDWAAEDLNDVSVSMVEMNAHIQFFNGIPTEMVHETLIKSTADLISPNTPDYQYMAGRLAIFHIRKIAFGDYTPPPLKEHIAKLVNDNRYDKNILEKYSEKELDYLDEVIDHNRDLNLAYAATQQMIGKYLVQDRVTKRVYESPQFLFMLVAMTGFIDYPKETRLDFVTRFYNALSKLEISLPTPIMGGLRTPTRQFSSCVTINCGDSLDSINASSNAIVNYISQRAGIGINAGAIRALNSPIRNGEAVHTGVIPFYKLFQAAVKSCSQGALRGGAATLFYPFWHLEVESLLVLKNNRGVEENRVRHLDYGVQLNKLMYERFLKKENITLFSPNEVPGLYTSFFADQDKFNELYVKYENDPSIRKKSVPASELFSLLMNERASTGRIYIQNVDHCNEHGSFIPEVAPIEQSNLCMEITLPTSPISVKNPDEGEISLCTLAAVNLGNIGDSPYMYDNMRERTELLVRFLDNLLDYQDYPVLAAEKSTRNRRPLGIGVINYAYWLAQNFRTYNDDAIEPTHRLFEALQYFCLEASNTLAKEKGACGWFDQTKYSKGILPIDTYKKTLDDICKAEYVLEWEKLRENIKKYGLRNSTLTSLMPSETSSQVSNATNGIEPPRGLVSVKVSKDGIIKQVVPGVENLASIYPLLWNLPDNSGYLKLAAVMQKFVDQSISANTNYDPAKFPNGKVPLSVMLKDLLTAYKLGIKTLYYHNTRDGADDSQNDLDDGCAGGACKI